MANIKIISECPLFDGMPVTFKAPCDCTAVEGLVVAYGDTSQTFTFRDAHGNNLAGIGNLFEAGAYVKAVLDTVNGYAYLQNADTNAYLEGQIAAAQTTANSKAPMYTYGTTDLTAGTSTLETGKLHFVYE